VIRDDKGTLWFAGDRRISWHFGKALKSPRPKITYRNKVLLAGTGTSCICDLVTDQFDIPIKTDQQDTFNYIHTTFVPKLIKWLRQEGWVSEGERKLSTSDDDGKSELGATILIGVESDLYELDIDTNMICADVIDAPYAAGCGGALAHGSLLTTESLDYSPKKRLTIALKVAAKVSPGCDDNVDILNNRK